MKNITLALIIGIISVSSSLLANDGKKENNIENTMNNEVNVGWFEAEGKKVDVKFVRVIWAAEGSERPGESNSIQQLVFDSVDPNGNKVKVYRYQITAKNTGYDDIQEDKDADYKMKSVTEGVKLHVEVPLDASGAPQFEKAYIGNLAYNFGTKETRHNLSGETVKDLKFKINKIELPSFGAEHKPGDQGMIYHAGYIDFTLTSKAKKIDSDEFVPFNIHINGPITLTHLRGKEREANAVSINQDVVAKNIQ